MSVGLHPVLAFLFRVVFFASGLTVFVLSFFHGPDFNVLLLAGIALVVAAGSPYTVSSKNFQIWGILVCSIALLLNGYLVFSIMVSTGSESPMGLWDVIFFIPPLCLMYLLFYFFHVRVKG